MARQAGHLGQPEDALELIHLARYGARQTATPTIDALLHSLEARYCAMMGRLKDFDRAAGQAEAAFADSNPADDPAWVAYFDTASTMQRSGFATRSWRRPQALARRD